MRLVTETVHHPDGSRSSRLVELPDEAPDPVAVLAQTVHSLDETVAVLAAEILGGA